MAGDPIKKWTLLNTEATQELKRVCALSYEHSLMMAVFAATGLGKTTTFNWFKDQHPGGVFLVKIEKEWNSRTLYLKILEQVGVVDYLERWITIDVLSNKFADTILENNRKCLFIFDEAGKFTANMLEYFQTIRDKTENNMGIILSGTHEFKGNLDKWRMKQKGAIPELYSRFTQVVEIGAPTKSELLAVAKQNGIKDPQILKKLVSESENFRDVYNKTVTYRAGQAYEAAELIEEETAELVPR